MVLHEDERDKYEHPDAADFGCGDRIPHCRAICCALETPLTQQDVDEGVARWDPARPYWLAHRPDGYCVHLDPETRVCQIHDRRPLACRTYLCVGDPDIWTDVLAMTPNDAGIDGLLARCRRRHAGGRRP